jgi:hypothetical protein
MKIVVRTLRSAEPELDRWVASLPGSDPERRALARMHLENLYQWIEMHRGNPPGAREVPGLSPLSYWWEFFPGWWMRIAVVDQKRWFRVVVRKLLIHAIQDEPPDESNVAI